MELRSSTHLHFIQAVEGGSVTKILNVCSGRPALKFKKIDDIYEAGVARNHDSFPALRPKVESVDLPIDCDRAKTESPCMLVGERTTIKHESETLEPSCGTCDYGVKTELDDLNFVTVTLKQIKESCHAKKRKRSISVGLSKQTTETYSPGKQDHSILQSEDDEYDIMEPLSRWKSRMLKDMKTKARCIKSKVSTSSQHASPIAKSDRIPSDQLILQSCGNLPALADSKTEFHEPSHSDSQNITVIAVDSSCGSNELVGSGQMVSSEEPEAANDCVLENRISMVSIEESEAAKDCLLETGMPRISSEEPETANDHGFVAPTSTFFSNESQCCVVNEESYEHTECIDPIGPEASNDYVLENRISVASIEEPETVKDCQMETGMPRVSSEEPETANDYGFGAQTSTFFNDDFQFCVVNEESYEHTAHIDPESILDVRACEGDVMMVDNAEIVSHQFSNLLLSELKIEDSVIDTHPIDGFYETVSPSTDYRSDLYDKCQSFPGIHDETWKANNSSQVQLPDVTIGNSLQCMELSNRHALCDSENRVEESALHLEASVISSPVSDCSSFWDSNLCSTQDSCLVSAADGSSTVEEKQYTLPACVDAVSNCSKVIHSHVGEPVTLVEAEDCHDSNMQHPPERLLSTRKVISPTSQKRLCKAMESTELDDEQYYKYTRKLCYSKQIDNKIGRLERTNQIQRVDVTVSPKKIVEKPKNDKNGFHNKGILKVPRTSHAVPRFATGCASAQSCSESVISFSQQQMRDFELIATKLAKELKSMKDIVEGTLQSEVYPATSLQYSADEVRIAIRSATRVEDSARRWLSIMARDCNRFCKIMKFTEKGSAASENVVHKEKRKIVFADEAGGQLCDVKTFKNDMASVAESHGEKPGIVD